jgi:NADH-ubiquinone oxidoreductase chain 4L
LVYKTNIFLKLLELFNVDTSLFFLHFFFGIWVFCSSRKHLLITLLRLEFLVLALFIIIFFICVYLTMNFILLCFFLVLSVCEGSLGLSILVSMIRGFGNDCTVLPLYFIVGTSTGIQLEIAVVCFDDPPKLNHHGQRPTLRSPFYTTFRGEVSYFTTDGQSVSQSVCLGIEYPCGTCDQILLPVGMFVLSSVNVTHSLLKLYQDMFRPHTAIISYRILSSRGCCSPMPIFPLCGVASHVLDMSFS